MEDRFVLFGNVVCRSGRKMAEPKPERGFFPLSLLSAAERGFCLFLSVSVPSGTELLLLFHFNVGFPYISF